MRSTGRVSDYGAVASRLGPASGGARRPASAGAPAVRWRNLRFPAPELWCLGFPRWTEWPQAWFAPWSNWTEPDRTEPDRNCRVFWFWSCAEFLVAERKNKARKRKREEKMKRMCLGVIYKGKWFLMAVNALLFFLSFLSQFLCVFLWLCLGDCFCAISSITKATSFHYAQLYGYFPTVVTEQKNLEYGVLRIALLRLSYYTDSQMSHSTSQPDQLQPN